MHIRKVLAELSRRLCEVEVRLEAIEGGLGGAVDLIGFKLEEDEWVEEEEVPDEVEWWEDR